VSGINDRNRRSKLIERHDSLTRSIDRECRSKPRAREVQFL
jgi:hypothetical protein